MSSIFNEKAVCDVDRTRGHSSQRTSTKSNVLAHVYIPDGGWWVGVSSRREPPDFVVVFGACGRFKKLIRIEVFAHQMVSFQVAD